MSANSLFITITIVLLILPATAELINRKERTKWYKRLTGWGIMFYIAVFLGAFLQFKQEKLNSENEILLKNQIDSLTVIALNNSDTISNLKGILNSLKIMISSIDNKSGSIERQLYITNEKVSVFGKNNDSLNKIMLESDRPLINLHSAKITIDGVIRNKHVDFTFVNAGKRPATNLSGKVYGVKDDIVFKDATLPFSTSEIYTLNRAFTSHMNLMFNFNPDSTSFDAPLYYFHEIAYSDLITGATYNFEIATKIEPFTKGKYVTALSLCSYYEVAKMKRVIESYLNDLKKQGKFKLLFTPEGFIYFPED